jgi:surfactin synthase thioesterase subunit
VVHPHGGRQSWLRTYHPTPLAPVRLVCFPHAGGTAGAFHDLAGLLAPDVEVVAVQYPGRQDRFSEPCASSIEELADGTAAALAPLTDRPLALFGHSMGALVAFEVARRCARNCRLDLVRLFASGNCAPHAVRDEGLHALDDAGLLDQVRSLDGTGSDIFHDDDLVELILPAIRADYRAVETYRCTPARALSCPIDAFTGDTDPDVSPADLDAWREHTTAEFVSTVFPGGHFYLVDQVSAVAAALRHGLSAPREAPAPKR